MRYGVPMSKKWYNLFVSVGDSPETAAESNAGPPAPNAAAFPRETVPSWMVVRPLKSFDVARVRVPLPSLVSDPFPPRCPLPLKV